MNDLFFILDNVFYLAFLISILRLVITITISVCVKNSDIITKILLLSDTFNVYYISWIALFRNFGLVILNFEIFNKSICLKFG